MKQFLRRLINGLAIIFGAAACIGMFVGLIALIIHFSVSLYMICIALLIFLSHGIGKDCDDGRGKGLWFWSWGRPDRMDKK